MPQAQGTGHRVNKHYSGDCVSKQCLVVWKVRLHILAKLRGSFDLYNTTVAEKNVELDNCQQEGDRWNIPHKL